MRGLRLRVVGGALASALVLACSSDDAPTDELGDESGESDESGETGGEPQWPTVDLDALPYEYLSEYGFFVGEDLSALEPAAGVHPYTVVSPLFSDFAGKARFMDDRMERFFRSATVYSRYASSRATSARAPSRPSNSAAAASPPASSTRIR